jgi:hypothetical protein
MGSRNIPYVGQDTNLAIESYHENLKATLKATKSWLSERWVIGASRSYWRMFSLITNAKVLENWGFFPNEKHERII